jgi:uncharacterized repeat protein (TIGR03803 family)
MKTKTNMKVVFMSARRILEVLKTNWNGSRHSALACILLVGFAVAPLHAQSFQDLYNFDCSTGGCTPFNFGQLTQGADGNLYGTTAYGGTAGDGTVFKVTPSGAYTSLWQFDGATTGAGPVGGLTLASDGNFYGTTQNGGTFGYGTLFRINSSGSLTVLHHFTNGADGENPLVPPVEAKDGNLYGVTLPGTTYRVTLPAGKFVQLPNYVPFEPSAPLLPASDGNLYGTSRFGGIANNGTVFRLTTGGAVKIIYNFPSSDTDGEDPAGPLVQGADGNLYGTTQYGGANFTTGEVFKLTLSGTLTVLHSFDPLVACGSQWCNNDGVNPYAGLLTASDGNLYGVNSQGGAFGYGTIFKITTAGSFTKLFDFTFAAGIAQGALPLTTLMEHTNGAFYGLSYEGGGPSGVGNFFSLTPTTRISIVKVEGPIFVHPGVPVQILGNNLTHAVEVTFAGEQTQFQVGSDTNLVAQVPNDAVDGLIAVILDDGQQIETQSAEHLLPLITNLDPTSGPVGTQVGIVGGGFAGAKKVTFGGVKATNFMVASPTLIQAIVPTGAKTGKVVVTTPNGSARSKQTFTVT